MLITSDETLNKYFGLSPRLCYYCNLKERIRSTGMAKYLTYAITGLIITAFSLLNMGFESSGVFALIITTTSIIYIGIHKLVLERRYPQFTIHIEQLSKCILSFLLGIIIISTTFESIPINIAISSALAIAAVFTFIYTYILFVRLRTNKTWLACFQKIGWIKIIFIANTSLFLVAASYDDDSLIDITGMIWILSFLLLTASWIFKQIKSIINLKKEKKETELLHLKSQVNPHFFFNMLNNLYALVDEDSEKAKKLILGLSDLMRYSIYEGDRNVVPIHEEITYIQNFLELHEMRYHKEIDIQFTKDLEDTSINIMPLMFVILVENAFKHGVEKLPKNAYVHISIKGNKKQLTFDVKNNFDLDEVTDEKGIGLSNLRRRLELVYPKRHQLDINIHQNIYSARLSLQL